MAAADSGPDGEADLIAGTIEIDEQCVVLNERGHRQEQT